MNSPKMPRANLTLARKLEILKELDKHERPNYSNLGRQFNLDRTTISKIHKSREIILNDAKNGANLLRQRNRNVKEVEVNNALIAWFREVNAAGVRVTGPMLKAQAINIAASLNHGFSPYQGWLSRFKQRYSIVFDKVNGCQFKIDPTELEAIHNTSATEQLILQGNTNGVEANGGNSVHSMSDPVQNSFAPGTSTPPKYMFLKPRLSSPDIVETRYDTDMEDSIDYEESTSSYSTPTPSNRELLNSLDCIRKVMQTYDLSPAEPFSEIEKKILDIAASSKKQTTIDSFFKKL